MWLWILWLLCFFGDPGISFLALRQGQVPAGVVQNQQSTHSSQAQTVLTVQKRSRHLTYNQKPTAKLR